MTSGAQPPIVGTARRLDEADPLAVYVGVPNASGGKPYVVRVDATAWRLTPAGWLFVTDEHGEHVADFAPNRWLWVSRMLEAVSVL